MFTVGNTAVWAAAFFSVAGMLVAEIPTAYARYLALAGQLTGPAIGDPFALPLLWISVFVIVVVSGGGPGPRRHAALVPLDWQVQ